MTRMIERWFPCAEVSVASQSGWGTGNNEKELFTWFAARPLAQARAAVVTSLLPWPDDPGEQRRLQGIVRAGLADRDEGLTELSNAVKAHLPTAAVLDPFSGRAMIPLEAARIGVRAWGVDYSAVASLAGRLLAEYPLTDWSDEPPLPFGQASSLMTSRLLSDVNTVLEEIGRRHRAEMSTFYPPHHGVQPWGYIWVSTLPCQECGRRFPLSGSTVLRHPQPAKGNPGESYRFVPDARTGTFSAELRPGVSELTPTLVAVAGKRGKSAVCVFCSHVHPKAVHTRLAKEGMREDHLLLVANPHGSGGAPYRLPTEEDTAASELAAAALSAEEAFGPNLPAIPDERIPSGNHDTVRPSAYGATTYGDLANARQTLSFIKVARAINDLSREIRDVGVSDDYTRALAGYAGAVLVRLLKKGTRGTTLNAYGTPRANHIFVNEASIGFSYDHFEAGLGKGSGTWESLSKGVVGLLEDVRLAEVPMPARILHGSALSLPLPDASCDAVVTDPPYDSMIDYSDASDLFYVWLKRALFNSHPEFSITSHPAGVQEKGEEVIVKRGGSSVNDHRNQSHYDRSMEQAFREARRVVKDDGIVAIVFGHGDIDVWDRLLTSIADAGLYVTGSWPAQTESGGKAGSANIVTTLTMCCRPAPRVRPTGRVNEVDGEVRAEIRSRINLWEESDLATHDQLMAAVGPAMEVVGRYSEVLDRRGQPVPLERYLVLARRAVREAQDVKIDGLPLDTFDVRTRFALDWVRLYGRAVAPASEARWQALATDLDYADVVGSVLRRAKVKGADGVRLALASEAETDVTPESPLIEVVFAFAAAAENGLAEAGEVLVAAGREADDSHLWAAIGYLADRLPEADPDQQAWTRLIRARSGVASAARQAATVRESAARSAEDQGRQGNLFGAAQSSLLGDDQRRLDEQ